MDRIVVNTNADMLRVLEWAEKLHGLPVELIFPAGEIVFREEELMLRFKDGADGVSFEMYVGRNGFSEDGGDPDWIKVVEWRCDVEKGETVELRIAAEGKRKVEVGGLLLKDDTVGKCIRKFRAIMLFAAYYREEVERTRTVTRTGGGSRKKSGKRRDRRPLTLRRYTISEEMLGELPAPKRVWKGYAESFGVRGHYRRYRSGKVVWVRPYVKHGREETKSDREYIL